MRVEILKDHGFDDSVISNLISLGYTELTKIQEIAINNGLFEGKNLLINSPTNTGKTFISELAFLSAAKRRKRTFFLVPLKALAEEKYDEFVHKYATWGLKVAITTGDRNEYDSNLCDFDVIISTYEKLNSLLLKIPNLFKEIGLVIIDEIQMINNEKRGVGLEILITWLKMNSKIQIIGLSATIPNSEELASWLDSNLVESVKREIELREGILYIGNKSFLFNSFTVNQMDFVYREHNTENILIEKLNIATEKEIANLSKNEKTLIFNRTRKETETFSDKLCKHRSPDPGLKKWIDELEISVENTPTTRLLKKCLLSGIAFHHAGLLAEEKKIINEAFKDGNLNIICTTTTLGAGVNLPAKNILLFSTKYWNGSNISVCDYKNMSGRAGRLGYHDDFGRSIIYAESEKDFTSIWNSYIEIEPEIVQSQLSNFDLKKPILILIASNLCKKADTIIKFFENALFGFQSMKNATNTSKLKFKRKINNCIQELIQMKFISKEKSRELTTTDLGNICAEEMLSPNSIVLIFEILLKEKKNIHLSKNFEDLHDLFLYLALYCKDDSYLLFAPSYSEKRERIQLKEYWFNSGIVYPFTKEDDEIILRTTKTLFLLKEWIKGVSFSNLGKYDRPGTIKDVARTISWILKAIIRVAELPGLGFNKEIIIGLEKLADRVRFGVTETAIDIMKLNIPGIHRFRAMSLASNNFTTLKSLLMSNLDDLKLITGFSYLLAKNVKEFLTNFVYDDLEKKYYNFITLAKELGRNTAIIDNLFTCTDEAFEKACVEFFNVHLKIQCTHIGNIDKHEPDFLITSDNEKLLIECKRKKGKGLVSAKEGEEILGKSAKYKPYAGLIVIGYPDFSEELIKNLPNTGITLFTIPALVKILLNYWENKINTIDIINLLKNKDYNRD